MVLLIPAARAAGLVCAIGISSVLDSHLAYAQGLCMAVTVSGHAGIHDNIDDA